MSGPPAPRAVVPTQCKECGLELQSFERRIQVLKEMLEYSHLQNSLLRVERDQLKQDLRDAEFRGRSSVTATSVAPSLPEEVLRYIFSLATHFEGLALPRWHGIPDVRWHVSSQVRRTIPLVCRRWYNIGLEYLYQHVVIFRKSQTRRLMTTLNTLNPNTRQLRTGWIQALELHISNIYDSTFDAFIRPASLLVGLLPDGKLHKLAVVGGDCENGKGNITGKFIKSLLHKSRQTLEMVHLPCRQYSAYISELSCLRVRTLALASGWTSSTGASGDAVRGGYWNSCGCNLTTNPPLQAGDSSWIRSITSLSITAQSNHTDIKPFFEFLDAVINLDTVHIAYERRIHWDQLLSGIPRVTRLLITLDEQYWLGLREEANEFSHTLLEQIEIYAPNWKGHAFSIFYKLSALMLKVQSGKLPNLQRIVIHGNFSGGYLDDYRRVLHDERELWKLAIRACAERGVELVNAQGHTIKLWRVLHPKFVITTNNDTSSAEDDDEWYERSDTTSLCPSEIREDTISDSDDEPYRFVYRPDIAQVDPDSEGSSEESD